MQFVKTMIDNITQYCYVCGFEFSKSPCYEHMKYPYYDCPCCGFEYGIEEFESEAYMNSREKWINDGLKLCSKSCFPNPSEWSVESAVTQLSNLNGIKIINIHFRKLNPNFSGNFDLEKIKSKWKGNL